MRISATASCARSDQPALPARLQSGQEKSAL